VDDAFFRQHTIGIFVHSISILHCFSFFRIHITATAADSRNKYLGRHGRMRVSLLCSR
jgi:hypothetical protein